MKHLLSLLLVAILFVSCTAKTEVYFIPTIHQAHRINPNYNYDSLKAIVAGLHPDVIAVEIRPEDMGREANFFLRNYPEEMWRMKEWFPQTAVAGFDWFGKDIEGQITPDNYWETNPVKLLEQQLGQDTVYTAKMRLCDQRMEERMQILMTSTLEQLLKSTDAEIVAETYACMKEQLKGSPYEKIMEQSVQRNEHILANINKIIADNKGKRIIILTGNDHYQLLKDRLPHNPLYKE